MIVAEVLLKAVAAGVLHVTAKALWDRARRWNLTGEVPAEAVEAIKRLPVKRGERSFKATLGWERVMAGLVWLFAALLLLSALLQLAGFPL